MRDGNRRLHGSCLSEVHLGDSSPTPRRSPLWFGFTSLRLTLLRFRGAYHSASPPAIPYGINRSHSIHLPVTLPTFEKPLTPKITPCSDLTMLPTMIISYPVTLFTDRTGNADEHEPETYYIREYNKIVPYHQCLL